MTDAFLQLARGERTPRHRSVTPGHAVGGVAPGHQPSRFMKKHGIRAHSKFSASGAERWTSCSGSVQLSEGLPDRETVWSKEGTTAHEVLEELMIAAIAIGAHQIDHANFGRNPRVPREMIGWALHAANFILGKFASTPGSEVFAEKRIYLDFIHPEMFGTFDGAVVDYWGTLHIFDYKYGAGHAVSPVKNLQMIFYALGLAHEHHWNFKRVRMWIIQPRIRGYDGPLFWEISLEQLKSYVGFFERAVRRVEREPEKFVEGSWCHWCKAKGKCPLKLAAKVEAAKSIFTIAPISG